MRINNRNKTTGTPVRHATLTTGRTEGRAAVECNATKCSKHNFQKPSLTLDGLTAWNCQLKTVRPKLSADSAILETQKSNFQFCLVIVDRVNHRGYEQQTSTTRKTAPMVMQRLGSPCSWKGNQAKSELAGCIGGDKNTNPIADAWWRQQDVQRGMPTVQTTVKSGNTIRKRRTTKTIADVKYYSLTLRYKTKG